MKRKAEVARFYIEDDYAPDMAARLIEKRGEKELGALYAEQGKEGLRLVVTAEMEPIGAEPGEIETVLLEVANKLDAYRYAPKPTGLPDGAYPVFRRGW